MVVVFRSEIWSLKFIKMKNIFVFDTLFFNLHSNSILKETTIIFFANSSLDLVSPDYEFLRKFLDFARFF